MKMEEPEDQINSATHERLVIFFLAAVYVFIFLKIMFL